MRSAWQCDVDAAAAETKAKVRTRQSLVDRTRAIAVLLYYVSEVATADGGTVARGFLPLFVSFARFRELRDRFCAFVCVVVTALGTFSR